MKRFSTFLFAITLFMSTSFKARACTDALSCILETTAAVVLVPMLANIGLAGAAAGESWVAKDQLANLNSTQVEERTKSELEASFAFYLANALGTGASIALVIDTALCSSRMCGEDNLKGKKALAGVATVSTIASIVGLSLLGDAYSTAKDRVTDNSLKVALITGAINTGLALIGTAAAWNWLRKTTTRA